MKQDRRVCPRWRCFWRFTGWTYSFPLPRCRLSSWLLGQFVSPVLNDLWFALHGLPSPQSFFESLCMIDSSSRLQLFLLLHCKRLQGALLCVYVWSIGLAVKFPFSSQGGWGREGGLAKLCQRSSLHASQNVLSRLSSVVFLARTFSSLRAEKEKTKNFRFFPFFGRKNYASKMILVVAAGRERKK